MCLISIIFFAYQWILGFCLLSFVGFSSAWQLNLLLVGRFLPKAKTKEKKFGKGLPTFDVHTWREGNIKLFDEVNVLFKLGFILSRNPFFMLSGLKEIHLILLGYAFGAISLCVDPTCRRSESLSLAVWIE